MGRKTWQSIGRPLPGRTSLVLSRDPGFDCPGCTRVSSLAAALELAQAAGESELFVIGGGEVFAQALPLAQRLYLTHVQARLECDTFFPVFDAGEWREVEREEVGVDERNEYATVFRVLERGG
jgi:dihydrofolate reductase